jgi:hypothetical protein
MLSGDKNLKSAENFGLRLAQTILWCAPRVDVSNPKDCLRTPELRPRVFERDRFSAVDFVAGERERYGGVEFQDAEVPKGLGGGHLLAYFPETNLYDGAAEIHTDGFLDVDNLPGWDTWVAFFEDEPETNYGSYLIAWIPPEFIELVSEGIAYNPEECIMWLSDANVSFARYLRLEGMLA